MTEGEASATRTRTTADDVLRTLLREADAGDLSQPSAARVRALELLGRDVGLFADRVEITIGRAGE